MEEEEVLERVRQVLGVRHVIRVCSSAEHAKVMAAAERLLEHADVIRQSGVNLAGMALPKIGSLAIACSVPKQDLCWQICLRRSGWVVHVAASTKT